MIIKLLDSTEARINFNENDPAFWYFRDAWDGYRDKIDRRYDRTTLIQYLRKYFPENEDAALSKPLGSFRKYDATSEPSLSEIYEDWKKLIETPQKSIIGKKLSFLDVCLKACYNRMMDEFGYEKFSMVRLAQAFSFMLWRCAQGVQLEARAIFTLRKLYEDYKGVEIVVAPYELEEEQVDAILVDARTGESLINISIKSFGALNSYSIDAFRNKRNRKMPDIYVGFESKDTEKLTVIYPEGISKEDLRNKWKHLV